MRVPTYAPTSDRTSIRSCLPAEGAKGVIEGERGGLGGGLGGVVGLLVIVDREVVRVEGVRGKLN